MIITIHEITPFILENIQKLKNPKIDLITFDDGLYSQYYYRKYFYQLNKPLVYFISSSIICENPENQIIDIDCKTAHKLAFSGNFKPYMTLSQIQEIQREGYEIGTHNHNHKRFTSIIDFKENLNKSLDFFKENNIKISKYCSPYNQDFYFGEVYVKSKDLEYFGKNRIDILKFI